MDANYYKSMNTALQKTLEETQRQYNGNVHIM
jgi:hypothetical protein